MNRGSREIRHEGIKPDFSFRERFRESIEEGDEVVARLKAYGGIQRLYGIIAEKKLSKGKTMYAFTERALEAYKEGEVWLVENMYTHGTKLQKAGAVMATIECQKTLPDQKLTEISQNKKYGYLQRSCAKWILELRAEEKKYQELPLSYEVKTDTRWND